ECERGGGPRDLHGEERQRVVSPPGNADDKPAVRDVIDRKEPHPRLPLVEQRVQIKVSGGFGPDERRRVGLRAERRGGRKGKSRKPSSASGIPLRESADRD